MNRFFLLLSVGALLSTPTFAQNPIFAQVGATNTPPQGGGGPHGGGDRPGRLTPEEQEELHADRQAALQANPALAAEFQDLMQKMQACQKKLDAAMIKIDPQVAPVITKMEAARQHRDGFGGGGGPGGPQQQNKPPGN